MAAVARFCTLGSVRTRGRRVGRWLEVGPLDWRRVSAPLAVPGLGVAWDTTLLLFFLFFLPFPDPSGPSRIPDLLHPFGVERGWVHSLSLFFPIFIPYIIVIIITRRKGFGILNLRHTSKSFIKIHFICLLNTFSLLETLNGSYL